jgi:agmatinase
MPTDEVAHKDDVNFLDCPNAELNDAEICILPLPFEGTVSYGSGTAAGPAAIISASTQVELWDDELNFDLESLKYHVAADITPQADEPADQYLSHVESSCRELSGDGRLIIGIGGEHSLTPPLVKAVAKNGGDLSGLTVVQIDAHTDLRDTYEGTPQSHACAMRRLTERGAKVIAIGIRAMSRPEDEYAKSVGLIDIYRAQALAEVPGLEERLTTQLRNVTGDVYLTVDIDGLDPSMCPGTGTPEPGGLGWWQMLRILRAILHENRTRNLIGCDLVETVPQPRTQINEFTAARLLAKMIAYAKAPTG